LEIRLFLEATLGEEFHQALFAQTPAELGRSGFVLLDVKEKLCQARALERHAFLGLHDMIFRSALHQLMREFALVANIFFSFAALHAVERWLRDVNVPAVD